MNYESILNELRPTPKEIEAVNETTEKVIDFINELCEKEDIDAKANAVGSVAKNTWLRGKSDIDIFISFPIDTDMDYLKENGLDIAYKTNDALNGNASEHYASHPYLTCDIDGFEVDIVPCYAIEEGQSIISAVDRTILHTRYIQKHLSKEQEDEVLLLKKFMDAVGTYGSEFKTGGFAGYLCELLILKYGTFEKTLRAAQNWKKHTEIDLEGYGTAGNAIFKDDPLVFIDPTDKNRNVGAALRMERYVDFIVASRNFLEIADDNDLNEGEKQEKIIEFFKPLQKEHLFGKSNEEIANYIMDSFKDRETQTLVIKFPIPEMSADALHPQLLKTVSSICEKIEMEEFSVFKYDYWTDEERFVIFTIELNVFKQGKYYIHKGPKVWPKKACSNFKKKWQDAIYPLDEFMVLTREREFKTAKEFIVHMLNMENIHIIKVGKNIKEAICNDHILLEIDEFLSDLVNQFNYDISNQNGEELAKDYLNSLDDFLNPGQYLKR
ncbi:MAG: CCA tRNA nucleotidyltransferase [Methanobrevibacter ruminantium]|uniref:CCA tRNA nucleotidyltransferase n=1 Tax=Methanobrevibacter ruminantium TaxID=83816 RepID=UPI0026EAA685|nr:CCA tRNA nucleotidyltransferase [Methanobrevibacter ruminantium]MDD6047983.1 CCA tRNA nucleotidyltransferase [Methanobrevibacter ruminantium]